ncbi:hypothetical protein EYF80_063247 [Liparis tanakae]|uniref:Uncharacterized protein n=1 Tax=Liparis tanakae TaxID=230148 RepID=A0A4Z2ECI5_9TELE|nr:hypothetical protein EYF80_063247 [Liparis tanakae]
MEGLAVSAGLRLTGPQGEIGGRPQKSSAASGTENPGATYHAWLTMGYGKTPVKLHLERGEELDSPLRRSEAELGLDAQAEGILHSADRVTRNFLSGAVENLRDWGTGPPGHHRGAEDTVARS